MGKIVGKSYIVKDVLRSPSIKEKMVSRGGGFVVMVRTHARQPPFSPVFSF